MLLTRRTMLAAGSAFLASTKLALTQPILKHDPVIAALTIRPQKELFQGFLKYLEDYDIHPRYAELVSCGDSFSFARFVEDVKQLKVKPDLIFSIATPVTLAVAGPCNEPDTGNKFIHDIPVLFSYVTTPQEVYIVENLQHPQRNVTGTIHIPTVDQQLNIIRRYKPDVKVIGSLFNPGEPNSTAIIQDIADICRKNNIKYITYPVELDNKNMPVVSSIIPLLKTLKSDGVEFISLIPDTFVTGMHGPLVAKTCIDLKLPTFTVNEPAVREYGALIGLVPNAYSVGQFTAKKAVQILSGVKISDIPVERIRKFFIVINMETAEAIDFLPPDELKHDVDAEPIIHTEEPKPAGSTACGILTWQQ